MIRYSCWDLDGDAVGNGGVAADDDVVDVDGFCLLGFRMKVRLLL